MVCYLQQNVDAGKDDGKAFLSNPEVTEYYCQLCMDRVEKYEMMDKPEGLFYVTDELNKKYQSRLTVHDIIDKHMELLSNWKIWIKLIKDEEELVALDWVNGKITMADNSWWERKLKVSFHFCSCCYFSFHFCSCCYIKLLEKI